MRSKNIFISQCFDRFMLLHCMLFVLFAGDVYAAQVKNYTVVVADEYADLIFTFNNNFKYTFKDTDQGLVLQFDKPIGNVDISDALFQLFPWVETIWASYDAILVKPNQSTKVGITKLRNFLTLRFTVIDKSDTSVRNTDTTRDISLARAKALLALKSGQYGLARANIEELISHYPQNIPLILDMARIESAVGRWRHSMSLYKRAAALNPHSLEIEALQQDLLCMHGSNISILAEQEEVGDVTTHWTRQVNGRISHQENVLTFDYTQIEAIEKSIVPLLNGSFQPYDIKRDYFEITFEMPINETIQGVSLYNNNKKIGVGWYVSQNSDFGKMELAISWRKPWMELPQAIAGYGTRDSLIVSYENRIGDRVSAYGKLSQLRYGLNSFDSVAKGSRLQLGTRYLFKPAFGQLSFGYGIDWENTRDLKTRSDRAGHFFYPLNLESRELHVIDAEWAANLNQVWSARSQIGYESDTQRKSNAPFGKFQLIYKSRDAIRWTTELQTGLPSYLDRNERYLKLNSKLTWFFD